MITIDYARRMAAYNAWMNDKVYAAAASLDDAARKQDRGAFFKSIHGTLNHLIYGDLAWLARFRGESTENVLPGAEFFSDFAVLREHRRSLDAELSAFVETLTPEWLAADFTYYSAAYGQRYTRPAWLLVTHVFNHQTHHRGQLTTLLSQCGLDVGATDLPVMPDL